MFENKKLLIGIGAGLFIVIIVVIILATRSGSSSGSGTQSTDLGPGKLTMWTPIDDPSVYEPYMEALNETDLTLTVVKKDPSTYEEELVDAIASGGGPDIYLIKNDWVPKHYKKISALASTETRYSSTVAEYKKMYPVAVANEMVGQKGDIFGYPLSSDPLVLYINKEIIRDVKKELSEAENGIDEATDEVLSNRPQNWDDFKQIVRLTTRKKGSTITQAGTALGTTGNIEKSEDILYLMMLQNGTKFVSSDGKSATFNLQQTTQKGSDVYPGTNALDLYTSFANPASDVYTWNESMPDAVDFFANGNMTMLIGYASNQDYIEQMNPNLEFDVVALPQVRQTLSPIGFMQYWAMTVNKNSQNVDLAWNLINYLTDSNQRSRYLSASKRNAIFVEDLESTDATKKIDGQVYKAKTVYKPDAAKYNKIMLKAIRDVTNSGQSTQSSLDDAARDITSLLGGN